MEEKKAIAISLVTASEKETGQTERLIERCAECGVVDQIQRLPRLNRSHLELCIIEGDNPVGVKRAAMRSGIRTRRDWEFLSNFQDLLENLNILLRPIAN